MAIDEGQAGVQGTVLSHLETKTQISAPNPGSLHQRESPTSQKTPQAPWAADLPGILLSLPLLHSTASTVSRGRAWPMLFASP